MNPEPSPTALRRRYARLAARLAKAGLLLHGTILARTIPRPPSARPGRDAPYGPYYQWTWKREGKSVTINLTASQARAYQTAIDNQRKVDRLLRQMRALSLEILEATTVSVKKRKPRH
jgi:hypothetical protein